MTKKLTLPGDSIGIVEELATGQGTFEDPAGNVASSVLGNAVIDEATRTASVRSPKTVKLPQKGDEVYAIVQDIYDQVSLVQISQGEGKERLAIGNSFAFLRISELSSSYVERYRDLVKIGDVLKAKIVEVSPLATYITIKAPELGVLKTHCTRCRTEIANNGASPLVCPTCKNKEYRKVAVV